VANAIMIQDLQLGIIDRDPNNPRQIFDEVKLKELAEDIAVRGVLQPALVRPHGKGRFMLVFGERRWRAAALIDLPTLPCIVRDMTDLDVLEAQIAENDKRSDVHPLEEADAYRRLHEEHGRDVEEIAALCGKSMATIYAAMKLCALTKEPRAAFLAGKLDKSRALLIARLPAAQQVKACGEIADRDDDDPISYRDAAHHIRRNYMLRLASAPFKVGDGLLVEKAGPCTTCPKRTGNQQELFADVMADKREGGGDVCTDSTCYQAKVDAQWARTKNEAEARGRKVLEGKAATEAGAYGSKGYVDLDRPAYELGDGNKTYRQVLGKHVEQAPITVARDPSSAAEIKELVSRSDLPGLLKDAGVKTPKNGNGHAGARQQDEAKQTAKLEGLVTRTLRDAIVGAAGDAHELSFGRLLARMALRVCRSDAKRDLLKHYNLEKAKDESGSLSHGQAEVLIKFIDTLKDVFELRSFLLEALMAESRGWTEYEFNDDDNDGFESDDERQASLSNLRDACELLGVDVPAIVAKVKADLAAAAKDKGKKAKAPAAVEAAS
jgi:ParB/RepB/Spo0J family partition protein